MPGILECRVSFYCCCCYVWESFYAQPFIPPPLFSCFFIHPASYSHSLAHTGSLCAVHVLAVKKMALWSQNLPLAQAEEQLQTFSSESTILQEELLWPAMPLRINWVPWVRQTFTVETEQLIATSPGSHCIRNFLHFEPVLSHWEKQDERIFALVRQDERCKFLT